MLERAAIRRYAAFLVAATAVRAYEPSPFWATTVRAGLASAWAAIRRSCGEVVPTSCGLPAAVVDNVGIAQGQGMPQIDQALEAVVGAIDALTEPQDGGPGVVLTLGGLVVSGRSSPPGSGSVRLSAPPVPRSWCTLEVHRRRAWWLGQAV